MKFSLRKSAAAALMVLAPLGAVMVAQPAAAQTYSYRVATVEQTTVRNLTVNSDAGLRPGATLRLQANATPGARWINVDLGQGIRVPLRERAPGEYVGTHVIRRSERIDPTVAMTVRAGWGAGPVAMAFNYPPSFQSAAMGAGPALQVERFAMWPRDTDRLDPGRVVHFRVEGTPGARVGVMVPDTVRWLSLREERPGSYVGEYTIRRRDDVSNFADARVVLRRGDDRVTAGLGGGGDRYGYGYGR